MFFGYKGRIRPFNPTIRFINHLILVAKLLIDIFKYSTSLEIKVLFDRELNVRSIKQKRKNPIKTADNDALLLLCMNRTLLSSYTHVKKYFWKPTVHIADHQ